MERNNAGEWEYVVRDYLEMKCALKEPEQDHLLDFLKAKGVQADTIRVYPAFSIADCLVVIVDGIRRRKCWFYHPAKRSIEE